MHVLVGVVVVGSDDAALCIVFQLEHIGTGLQLHACGQRLLHGNAAVVLRINRANGLAAVVAAAWRAAIKIAAVAGHGVAHHLERAGQALLRTLHGVRHGHFPHGEGFAARRARVGRAAHAHDFFGFLVVGLQVVVVKRPVHAYAVQAFDLEVTRHIAPGVRRPVPAGAAHHADVFGLVGVRASLHQVVVVLRLVDGVGSGVQRWIGRHPVAAAGRIAKTPHDFATRDMGTRFEHQYRSAGFGQLGRQHGADDAGADDDVVGREFVRISHGDGAS